MQEEFPAVFEGRQTIFIGTFKKVNDTIYMKERKFFLFPVWKPILSNIKEHISMYREKKLIDMYEGRTDNKVRIYPIDFDTFEYNDFGLNRDALHNIDNLRTEVNYFRALWRDMQELVATSSNIDRIQEFVKRQHKFYNEDLKPPFMFSPGGKNDKRTGK